MLKSYEVSYTLTFQGQIVIAAESHADAEETVRLMSKAELIRDSAECLTNLDLDVEEEF